MKKGIHPDYHEITYVMSDGSLNSFRFDAIYPASRITYLCPLDCSTQRLSHRLLCPDVAIYSIVTSSIALVRADFYDGAGAYGQQLTEVGREKTLLCDGSHPFVGTIWISQVHLDILVGRQKWHGSTTRFSRAIIKPGQGASLPYVTCH